MSKLLDYVWKKRENAMLFAASLTISLALYLMLQSSFQPDKEREFELSLTFANVGDDIIVLQPDRTVKVLASGTQQVLDALDISNVKALVDLAEAVPGTSPYLIEVTGPLRRGLSLSAVGGFVNVSIDERISMEMPIELDTSGVPAETFRYDGATIQPPTVMVSGPSTIVQSISSIRVLLNLALVAPNRTIKIDLEAVGAGNRPLPLITLDPPTVDVSPAVSIGPSMRKLLVTPVFLNQPAFGYRVIDYTVTPNLVEVTGSSGTVGRVTTVDTEPIDLSGLRQSRDFEVEVVLPSQLTAAGGTTVTIHVEVRRN